MSDREAAVTIMQGTYGHRGLARMALDQADEIERLRERGASLMLQEPSKTQGLYAAIDELQAEVERLREQNDKLWARDHTRGHRPTDDCFVCVRLGEIRGEREAHD